VFYKHDKFQGLRAATWTGSFWFVEDLMNADPEIEFPGLIPGDQWCLCALRWQEAFESGAAPNVLLSATDESALEVLNLEDLQQYAVDKNFENWNI